MTAQTTRNHGNLRNAEMEDVTTTPRPDWKEELEKFLDERCYEIGNPDEREMMAKIHPDYEGTWGVRKELLIELVASLLTLQKESIVGVLESKKKEMLDKSDPDNYEAIYAITGFNDAISKSVQAVKEIEI